MSIQRINLLSLLVLLLTATVALAVTEQELQTTATALLADYEALEISINACTNGICSEAQQLADDLDDLAVELAQLQSDRATLGSCGCQQLDATIDDIEDLDGTLGVVVSGWDDII